MIICAQLAKIKKQITDYLLVYNLIPKVKQSV